MMTKAVCLKIGSIALFLCAVFFVNSAVLADRDTASESIQSINEKYMNFFSGGDASSLAALYAEDAVLLPPDDDFVKGRDSITEYWERVLSSGAANILIEVIEIEESGDLAFETFRFTVTDEKNKELGSGKNIIILKRVKNGWKLYRDIWN